MALDIETGMPPNIARLERNPAGYPIPFFVARSDDDNGDPDFRIVGPSRLIAAMNRGKCFICGRLLFGSVAFTLGPMCAVNHTSAEPPAHPACAQYSARICPFLASPTKRRRVGGLPEEMAAPGGIMLERNPGVALVWITTQWEPVKLDNGLIFRFGDPTATYWWCEGREATRDEVMHSIETGLPALAEIAAKQGQEALDALSRSVVRALKHVPS